MKAVHKLPMTFESTVQPVYDRLTGKLLRYEVVVGLNCDGRVNVKPNQKVQVTITKWKRP
jgi:hypothetical protein